MSSILPVLDCIKTIQDEEIMQHREQVLVALERIESSTTATKGWNLGFWRPNPPRPTFSGNYEWLWSWKRLRWLCRELRESPAYHKKKVKHYSRLCDPDDWASCWWRTAKERRSPGTRCTGLLRCHKEIADTQFPQDFSDTVSVYRI